MNARSVFLALSLFAFPVFAQQPDNEIAVSLGWSVFNQLGSAPAAGVSYTHFWTDAFATRFGAFASHGDFNENGGEKTVSAYHGSAEYHFRRDQRVSPYVGAGIALAATSIDRPEIEFSASETSFEVIVSGGVDVDVSRRFAVGGDVRYMYYDVGLGARSGYQVNPLTILLSAKYRY